MNTRIDFEQVLAGRMYDIQVGSHSDECEDDCLPGVLCCIVR